MEFANPISVVIFLASASLGFYWIIIARRRVRYVKSRQQKMQGTSIEDLVSSIQQQKGDTQIKIDAGRLRIRQAREFLDQLEPQVAQIKVGLTPPTFRYDDSEELKEQIRSCRAEQYDLIALNKATVSYSEWEWFGSKTVGNQMLADYRYLLLKAFNSEFEVIVRKMRAKTIETAVDRLQKLHDQLTKLGETANVEVAHEYLQLKEKELYFWGLELTNREKLKEERKREREVLRANKKLAGMDIEDLEEDISATESELLKAQRKAEALAGEERKRLERQIEKIRKEKEALEEKFSRTVSQAQITRAGYIYVISNIGAFGDGIVKIGMTRRLEPMDRVRELGDASVPFKFDVHTIAFVDDAPSVEKALHQRFDEMRVNKENLRREFFRVPPGDVRAVFCEMGINSDWYLDVDAQEYRESVLLRESVSSAESKAALTDLLPESI